MTRMLGRTTPAWCPHCNAPPGPDCPNVGASTRQAKRREQQQTRRDLASLDGQTYPTDTEETP